MEYVIICNSVIRAQMRVGQNNCILSGLVLCEDAENLKKNNYVIGEQGEDGYFIYSVDLKKR